MNDDDTPQDPVDRLARFTLEHQHGQTVAPHDAIGGLEDVLRALQSADDLALHRRLGLPVDVTGADALAGLALLSGERAALDRQERRFIEAYLDRGGTWTSAAAALGTTAGALRQRYRRLGGTRTWTPGRPRATDPDQPRAGGGTAPNSTK